MALLWWISASENPEMDSHLVHHGRKFVDELHRDLHWKLLMKTYEISVQKWEMAWDNPIYDHARALSKWIRQWIHMWVLRISSIVQQNPWCQRCRRCREPGWVARSACRWPSCEVIHKKMLIIYTHTYIDMYVTMYIMYTYIESYIYITDVYTYIIIYNHIYIIYIHMSCLETMRAMMVDT